MHSMIPTDTAIKCLMIDIGGVLLTNGWDHEARKRAATLFGLDWADLEARHQLNFSIYEEGKLSLEEYLQRTVFFVQRSFSHLQFQEFMFAQSQAYPDMLQLIRTLKYRYGLKIVVLSNEARELNAHRIEHFGLAEFVDCFVSSCFVQLRKPDVDIFRLALDIVQIPVEQVLYIDNTLMFVQLAESWGIPSILHTDFRSTCSKLAAFGLVVEAETTVQVLSYQVPVSSAA